MHSKTLFLLFFVLFFIVKTFAQPPIHYGFLSELGRKPQWIVGGRAFNKMQIATESPSLAMQNVRFIPKNTDAFRNKIEKEYNLIFEETFDADTINTEKWCISAHNDDRPCDGFNGNDPIGDVNKPGLNTKNVTVKNGVCSIAITNESNGVCNYSGGELKTFSVVPNHTFKDYNFLPNAYIEMRAQIPFGPGIGSAAWLYAAGQGHYNEIDIWETLGNNATKLQSTYIEQMYDGTSKKYDYNWLDAIEHRFYNKKNKPQSLENQWLTIGLEWSDTAVIWWLNHQPLRHISMQKIPPCMAEWWFRDAMGDIFMSENKGLCRYVPYRKPLPFTFRIGTAYGCVGPNCGSGKNQLKYANLPKNLLIDEIKVYQKKGYKACVLQCADVLKKTKNADNVVYDDIWIRCSYLPEVRYEWSSDDFDIVDTERADVKKIVPKANLETHQVCNVVCTAVFPSGYREKLVKTIKIVE